MIQISHTQFGRLSQAQEGQFITRLIEYLHREFPPTRNEPSAPFRAEIVRQIARSQTYGLITEYEIATFVTCAWLAGPEFDTLHPEVQALLTSDRYTPGSKAAMLDIWINQALSEAI